MAEIQKVTDPAKIVTDPVLLAALTKQEIDKDYVEFVQDYGKRVKGESSPCARFYRDLKSDKRFMVISPIPMVDAGGVTIEAGWDYDKVYTARNNLFSAVVDGKQVTLTIKNDQPDGVKAGAILTFSPRVYLDNVEQKAGKVALLDTDPVNSNYTDNVLEWDYGICKRRLRLIEGRLLGSWVFDSNPKGEVRIAYNQSGDFKLVLGPYGTDEDTEIIKVEVFSEADYPMIVSDSLTFYPDADPETSSVDGEVSRTSVNETFSNIRTGAGNSAYPTANPVVMAGLRASTTGNQYSDLWRSIFLFDTSALADNVTITAAILSLYDSNSKADTFSTTPTYGVVASTPASNTNLVAADYSQLGVTALSNLIAFTVNQYNDFTLNAAGIAAISLTGVSKFGVRTNWDINNSPPTWGSGKQSYRYVYTAEQGTGYKPRLVVTYSTVTEKSSSDTGSGTETLNSRLLGTAESGSATDTSDLNKALISSDDGLGSELGGLLIDFLAGDDGSGCDALKALIGTGGSGSEMRLFDRPGQVKIPSKGVNI